MEESSIISFNEVKGDKKKLKIKMSKEEGTKYKDLFNQFSTSNEQTKKKVSDLQIFILTIISV